MTSAKTVLVSGATGHLGRWACHRLASNGWSVIAASRSGAVPEAPFGQTAVSMGALKVDLCSDAAVDVLKRVLTPEMRLVHLAAWHPPATASTGPGERRALIETNVLGTMRLLDAAKAAGTPHVVYASTFEVYGEPQQTPIAETHRTYPLTDYGATKLSGEHHLAAFAYEEKRTGVSLRMPAVYGPGEVTKRALPNFLSQCAAGVRPTVFGDGLDQRDQLHVRDAARAIECALGVDFAAQFAIGCNVSDGAAHTIEALAREAMRAAALEGEPERKERQKPRRDYHMSIARAQTLLGFEPSVSLAEGMAEQLAWLTAKK